MSREVCLTSAVHPEKIRQAQEKMPDPAILRDMAELFKVLADETRMRIITALENCELCVCDIAELLDVSQSAVSHQLRILRQAHLVRYRREGKNAFYTLDDDHIETIARFARSHVQETYGQK